MPADHVLEDLGNAELTEGLWRDPLSQPLGDLAMPSTPMPASCAGSTTAPLTTPLFQSSARSDEEDAADDPVDKHALVGSAILSGIFFVIMIVIVGTGAGKFFRVTPFEIPPQYFAIPGFVLLFLPVPYAMYHLARIFNQRRRDYEGSSFFERLSFGYRFYFFYVGRIHPEFRGSQNVMYVMTAYVVLVSAVFIYFMEYLK